jgi:Uri superfamily endonuclease
VLVIENPLPKHAHWLIDYLLEDRKILLVWDGSGRFNYPTQIADKLPFLS